MMFNLAYAAIAATTEKLKAAADDSPTGKHKECVWGCTVGEGLCAAFRYAVGCFEALGWCAGVLDLTGHETIIEAEENEDR